MNYHYHKMRFIHRSVKYDRDFVFAYCPANPQFDVKDMRCIKLINNYCNTEIVIYEGEISERLLEHMACSAIRGLGYYKKYCSLDNPNPSDPLSDLIVERDSPYANNNFRHTDLCLSIDTVGDEYRKIDITLIYNTVYDMINEIKIRISHITCDMHDSDKYRPAKRYLPFIIYSPTDIKLSLFKSLITELYQSEDHKDSNSERILKKLSDREMLKYISAKIDDSISLIKRCSPEYTQCSPEYTQ